MAEACAACRFWDVYDAPGCLYPGKLGDCRLHPPTICDAILRECLPRGRDQMKEMEIEHDIHLASAFPITHRESWCGEYQQKGPSA